MDQNRKSRMEQADGSRDTALERERVSDREQESDDRASGERMRNRESGPPDLGSSSDRAMMTGRSSESRIVPDDDVSPSDSSRSSERGRGSSGERNVGRSSESGSGERSRSGGITNRDLEREQCEQDQLPERGRSRSER